METTTEFHDNLSEEEEWMIIMSSQDTYSGIHHELKELINSTSRLKENIDKLCVGDVKQKNKAFKDNEELQQLYKERSKIKNKITKIEFNINNK